MKIDVITIVRNEQYMIKYFLRHYEQFAERIFIFNDRCTDDTMKIAESHPKVRPFPAPFKNGFTEQEFSECFYDAYHLYSRGHADWVMCVDCDEFVYYPWLSDSLETAKGLGVKGIKPYCYFMVSEVLPTTNGQIYDECKEGVRVERFDKLAVFNPNIELKYGDGRHTATYPEGTKVFQGLFLLHFKYPSRDYFIEKTKINFEGMPNKQDLEYRLRRGLRWYNWALKKKTKVI